MGLGNNSKRHHRFYGSLILLGLLNGCASVAKEIKVEQVSRIEIGKSTKDTVLNILGLPNRAESKTFQRDEKLDLWTYYKGQGRSTISAPVGVSPLGGLTGWWVIYIANIPVEERKNTAAVVVFDEHGVVVDLKTEGNGL